MFEQEFLYTFGGSTDIGNIKGMSRGSEARTAVEPVSLVYSDTPFDFDRHFNEIEQYAGEFRNAALEASDEKSILLVVNAI